MTTLIKFIKGLLPPFSQISKSEYAQMFQWSFSISYVIGVLLISGFYFFTVSKIKLLNKKQNRIILLLCLMVPFSLATCFLIHHNRFVSQNYSSIPSPHSYAPKKIPNVILIVLDTVRADRLSIYGPHGMTKNLEEIAKESVVYKNCIAPSPWTIPSHASLFTGLYPIEHGSINNLHAKVKSQKLRPRPLPEEWLTLAETFKNNGYKTGAVVANSGALHKMFKLNQGFQIYDSTKSIGDIYRSYPFRPLVHLFCHLSNIYPKFIKPRRTADDITKESFRALNKLIDSPFFFFINYMDAHDPYRPPSSFVKYFSDTSFPRLYRYKRSLLNSLEKLDKKSFNAYLLSQYDGEISFLDHHLGKFFSKLKALNIYDSSLIIITSDHGELFGEHGLRFHGNLMYEEAVKIPLVIKLPFSSKRGYDEKMISLVDLYPTILSICDLSIPDDISGKIIGHGSLPIVSELYSHKFGEHRILYDGEYKYMAYQRQREPELYDLKKDPLEKVNLSNKLPEVSATMDKNLKDWTKNHTSRHDKHKDRSGKIFSQEVEEGLKALGYISDGES